MFAISQLKADTLPYWFAWEAHVWVDRQSKIFYCWFWLIYHLANRYGAHGWDSHVNQDDYFSFLQRKAETMNSSPSACPSHHYVKSGTPVVILTLLWASNVS